jgi:hypothetical protein
MGGGDRILEEDVRAPVSGLSTHAIKSLSSTCPTARVTSLSTTLRSEASYLRARDLSPQNPCRLSLRDLLDHYS